jgi:hypothetical protein
MAAKTDFKVPLMQHGGRLIWREFREEPANGKRRPASADDLICRC